MPLQKFLLFLTDTQYVGLLIEIRTLYLFWGCLCIHDLIQAHLHSPGLGLLAKWTIWKDLILYTQAY
jgi:hypothetical protein